MLSAKHSLLLPAADRDIRVKIALSLTHERFNLVRFTDGMRSGA